jgi:S-adenosylmethionine/arginine decarboxylase-like enzyme
MTYGYELLLDMHACDIETFTRPSLENFFSDLCELIDMEKCVVHFWDDVGVTPEDQQTSPQTKGTSAVCFILTSTIVVHTLDLLEAVYVNIFSCKNFDPGVAEEFTRNWFKAESCMAKFVERI